MGARSLVFIAITASACLFARPSGGEAQEVSSEDQALIVARRAAARFEAGDFGTAATLLREAIALHETPALHINLALTLSRLERWYEARDAYVRYLELSPDGADRTEIEQAMRELDQRIEEAERVQPVEPPAEDVRVVEPGPREVEPIAAQKRNVAPWIVLGAGAALAIAGIPQSVLSANAANDARNAGSQQAAEAPAAAARTYAITADVFYAVGGAAMLGGFVWGLVSRPREDASVSFHVLPGGAAVSGRF